MASRPVLQSGDGFGDLKTIHQLGAIREDVRILMQCAVLPALPRSERMHYMLQIELKLDAFRDLLFTIRD